MAARPAISKSARKRLQQTRVARLATADTRRRPSVVPICFAFDGRALYTPLDLKPKRRTSGTLRRVQNIKANPDVALLVDDYREDWRRLWFILIRGRARLLRSGAQWRKAHRLLKRKYPQYRTSLLPADAPVIEILPRRIVVWGRL
ncbi:MAG: TIGR03668 family PPOX class F420-dependent oxidoreductase [Candidatus Acidiferrales bacterium]